MLDRLTIKKEVRAYLKGKWWKPFLAILLVTLAIQSISQPVLTLLRLFYPTTDYFVEYFRSLGCFLVIALIFAPLEISVSGYYIKFARGENPLLGSAFDGFKHYKSYVLTYAWYILWSYLWTLLLIIPGIIKSYAYMMVPYIASENPELSARKVLKLSIEITRGHKGELFVLGLSFIPWFLLGLVTFGIAYIYVLPYSQTTYATYYEKLKQLAILQGKVDPADFHNA